MNCRPYRTPNGVGKSTTIKFMVEIFYQDSGTIELNGRNVLANKKYCSQIGIVYEQRSQLWWDITVFESFNLLKEMYRISKKILKKH